MQAYTGLLKSCGIAEQCDLISALQLIEKRHSEDVNSVNSQSANQDLKLSIRILHELKSSELTDEDRERLLIPIHRYNFNVLFENFYFLGFLRDDK